MNYKSSTGGYVKIFIIVGVVLLAVSLGALYINNKISSQSTTQNTPTAGSDTKVGGVYVHDGVAKDGETGNEANKPSEEAANENNQESEIAATTNSEPVAEEANPEESKVSSEQENEAVVTHLPETGVGDFAGVVVLSAIVASGVAYMRSLRICK